MTFLIADTFTDSLARLTGDEQKAVKTTAFDLEMDQSAPGLNFHRLDKAKDKRFWSVRVYGAGIGRDSISANSCPWHANSRVINSSSALSDPASEFLDDLKGVSESARSR